MLFRDRAIIKLEEVDSTNNYAANLIKLSPPPEGTVITAQYQTNGKGQRNANWESNENENLLCSIILYPRFLKAENQFFLTQIISLAVQETIEAMLKTSVFIKWPNDIIVFDKKIGGILTEASWNEQHMSSAIVGIGINLNQTSFQNEKAISMRQVKKQFCSIDKCLTTLMTTVPKYYLKLQSGNFSEINSAYRDNLYKLGQVGRFHYNGKDIQATILGVDQIGRLRLKNSNNELIVCDLKEISMIL